MPVFNPTTPELRDFLIMASADTRNLVQAVETANSTITADKATQDAINLANAQAIAAAQATADTANTGVAAVNTIATQITDEMVINEFFSVPVTAFVVQASGLYHAVLDLIKIDGSKGVQMSLTDASGDEQGFSQLMAKYQGDVQKCAVELTATQYSGSEYPMSLVCQGQRLMSAPTVSGTPIGNGSSVSLADYVMTIKNSSGAITKTLTDVYQGWFTRNTIFVQYVNGTFTKIASPFTTETPSTIEEWDSANGGIVL